MVIGGWPLSSSQDRLWQLSRPACSRRLAALPIAWPARPSNPTRPPGSWPIWPLGGLAWRRGEAEQGMRLIHRAASRLETDPLLSSRADLQIDVAAVLVRYRISRPRPAIRRQSSGTGAQRGRDRPPSRCALSGPSGRCARKRAGGRGRWLTEARRSISRRRRARSTWSVTRWSSSLRLRRRKAVTRTACSTRETLTGWPGMLDLRLLQLRARLSPALLEFGRGRLEEAIAGYEGIRRLAAGWGSATRTTHPLPT